MAISDTIQSMYTNVGEVYDTITNVSLPEHKNIENIPSTIRDSYLEIMNNGIDVVWDNWEKVVGEGTSLTINNTEEAPMKVLLKGNTYQDSTTGKNLQPNELVSGSQGGITYVVNEDKSVTLNGTNTSGNVIYLRLCPNYTLSAGTYTLSNHNTNVGDSRAYFYDDGGSFTRTNISTKTFTEDTLIKPYIRIGATATLSDFTIYPMIEVGNQATSYEPYTNGASPNPDYPQDVHVVSGDNEVEVVGNNLLDRTQCIEDSILTWPAGAIYSNTNSLASGYIPINANEKVISTYRSQVMFYDSNKTYLGCLQTGGATIGKEGGDYFNSFTVPNISQIKYMRLGFRSSINNNINMNTASIMVNKGTTLATYTPYTSQSYAVNLGTMELCKIGDYQDRFFKTSGKNLFSSEMELGSLDNSTGATTSGSNSIRTKDYIEVKPNTTYTLSNNKNYHIYVYEYNSSKAFIQYKGDNVPAYAGKVSFTTTSTTEYIKVRTVASNVENDLSSLWQLEKGNISTPVYEPYGSNEWYLEKKIGKVVLDGTEAGWINDGGSAPYRITIDNASVFKNASEPPLCYTDKFLPVSYNSNWNNYNSMVSTASSTTTENGKKLKFRFTDISSLKDFKTWLSTHNTTVYYVLATPTYTKIEGTLASQLEALNGSKSYTPQTNISQNNNDMASVLNATALSNGTVTPSLQGIQTLSLGQNVDLQAQEPIEEQAEEVEEQGEEL